MHVYSRTLTVVQRMLSGQVIYKFPESNLVHPELSFMSKMGVFECRKFLLKVLLEGMWKEIG